MANYKILTLGDSNTAENGSGKATYAGGGAIDVWPRLLLAAVQSAKSGDTITLKNNGVGGSTSYDLLVALATALEDEQPSVVVIMHGTNDAWYDDPAGGFPRGDGADYSANGFRKRAYTIKHAAQALVDASGRTTNLVWLTPPPAAVQADGMTLWRDATRLNNIRQAIQAAATAAAVDAVDVWTSMQVPGTWKSDYLLDGVHLKQAGHQAICDAVLPKVLKTITSRFGLVGQIPYPWNFFYNGSNSFSGGEGIGRGRWDGGNKYVRDNPPGEGPTIPNTVLPGSYPDQKLVKTPRPIKLSGGQIRVYGDVGVSNGANWLVNRMENNGIGTGGPYVHTGTVIDPPNGNHIFQVVLEDLAETDPAKRFKMWYSDMTTIKYTYSADGITFPAGVTVIDGSQAWEWSSASGSGKYILPASAMFVDNELFLFYSARYGGAPGTPANWWRAGLARVSRANLESPYTNRFQQMELDNAQFFGREATLSTGASAGATSISVTSLPTGSNQFKIGDPVMIGSGNNVLTRDFTNITDIVGSPGGPGTIHLLNPLQTAKAAGGLVRHGMARSTIATFVFYDPTRNKFVMLATAFQEMEPYFFNGTTEDEVIAVADNPEGPYQYIYDESPSIRPLRLATDWDGQSCENHCFIADARHPVWSLFYISNQSIGRSFTQPYTIKEPVGRNCGQGYAIVGPTGRSCAQPYAVEAVKATLSLGMGWGIGGLIGRSLAQPSTIGQGVGRSMEFRYSIPTITTTYQLERSIGPPQVTYQTLRTVGVGASFPRGRSLTLPYEISPPVAAPIAMPYKVLVVTSRSLQVHYLIKTSIGKTLEMGYRINIGRSLDQEYKVNVHVARSCAMPSSITGQIAQSLLMPWDDSTNPGEFAAPIRLPSRARTRVPS